MEVEHIQEYRVLPLWTSYTLTVKSSEAKNKDEILYGDNGLKTTKELKDQEDQAFLEELESLKRQEKEADDAAATLRKTTLVNTASTPVNTASSLRNIPSLKDIYEVPNDGIFTSASYDDEGTVTDFKNLESTVNGHRQEEGIDYDEVFTHVARIEAIRIFLAFASYMGFIVYQMDVKSAFLFGKIDEEVAWYATLSTFLVQSGYKRGLIDKTLLIKNDKKDIMLVQQREDGIFISQDKYVADILKKFDFISVNTTNTSIETKKPLVKDAEAADVGVHLYKSMIGSLMYLTASRHDIMYAVFACSKFQVTPKTSHLHGVKRIFRYLKGQPKLGLWYPREPAFDLEAYSASDYAGENLDRKSTTRGCQFLGRRLISWHCKKQTIVTNSTTEAEYVTAASCCGHVLWIQNQMHHFIRDAYEKKLIQLLKIHTDDNVADLLTKAVYVSRMLKMPKYQMSSSSSKKRLNNNKVFEYILLVIKMPKLKKRKGDDENATNPPTVPPTPQAPHTISTIKLLILKEVGLHKGYGRFQSLLSQLKIHGAGVSTEDANQKFLRVFESDVKGSTASSSCTQNVAFVSSDSTNSTNEVSTAYDVSTSFGHNSQKEGSSSYTDDLISKRNQESKRRDAGNIGYKARDNGRRPAKQDEHKSMVTIDGEETLEFVPKPFESKPKAISEPKVWSDAPIIEEYELVSDDEYVFKALVEQKKPSYAFINTVKHVKTPRHTVKDQDTCSQNPKVSKREWTGLMSKRPGLGYGYTRRHALYVVVLVILLEIVTSMRKEWLNSPGAFGGSKGQITSKGKIRTGKLYFEDVYFVKELQHFNLFSVPQMCDKKNKVLFTYTECLVLSPDFKLFDENQVLLRVPRQTNMYSFNLEHIVPSGDLACLIANATIDESNKWHKKLGHVNFKNLNKLVKGNLVRGLPSKIFKNDHTCVACHKGKQHKASYQQDQAFLEELESLKRQKEADGASATLRKMFAQDTKDLLLQAGADRSNSINYANTSSTPVNTTSTPVNIASSLRNIPMADFTNLESTINVSPIPQSRIHSIHPTIQILGDPNLAVQTRSKMNKSSGVHAFKISQALKDESWVDAMLEELLQFKTQQVWILLDLSFGKKGHRQEERIDCDEVFALVARIEASRIFLAFVSYMGFIVYQMDVKSAFLYGKIDGEVYVSQPPGFIDPKFLKKVYKVIKDLYGLHQAPTAWYATLSTFLVQSGYRRELIDKTLFIKKDKKDIMLVQVYVDDIIFGSTKMSWCDEFEALMKSRFQMSSMGELTFFLGLQTANTPIKTKKPLINDAEAADVDVRLYRSMICSLMYLTASRPDIMYAVYACSRFQVTPKTSHLHAIKGIFRYIKGQPKLGLWYPRELAFDLEAYSDSDYA
nr:hypothetical protein [Tanacetum cinerariifolium]